MTTAVLSALIASSPTLTVVIGSLVAAVGWAAMFAAHRHHFWTRAALAGGAIAVYTVAVEPHVVGRLLSPARWELDVALGLGAGLLLYAVFWIGLQMLVVLLPTLAAEVGDLYTVRGETKPVYIPLILAIAAPAEELFFRGLVQLQAGFVLALLIYGIVHVWERKAILVIAALAGGLYWGGLLTLTGNLVAPLVSHLVWAMLIIVWRPARPTETARRLGARLQARLHRQPAG